MKLNSILTSVKTFNSKRVGRGIGCGKGKTCGRGVKGQKSRTGVSIGLMEGGQQSLLRALPKRGFRSHRDRSQHAIINLSQIKNMIDSGIIEDGCCLDKELMHKVGLIGKNNTRVKLLSSNCEYNYKVIISYGHMSEAAKQKLSGNVGQNN